MSYAKRIRFRTRVLLAALGSVALSLVSRADIVLDLEVQRPRVYEGETATLTVTADGDHEVKGVPAFPDLKGAQLEHFDTRSSSTRSFSLFNGKAEQVVSIRRTFYYRVIPSGTGTIRTGRAELRLDDGTLVRSRREGVIEVVGVSVRPDAMASISSSTNVVLVDTPFDVTLTISIRALDEPNGESEPIHPSHPLHISAPFLDSIEMRGLKLAPVDEYLAPLVAEDARSTSGFTVNGYQRRGMPSMGSLFDMSSFEDPFRAKPIVFRFPPTRAERGGTNFLDYAVSLPCRSVAEGSYTFGPATIKGAIVIGPDLDRHARLDPVYLVAPALTLRVVPPPEEGRPEFFVGAVGKGMAASASLDTDHCKVGDPLVLTLDLTGEVGKESLRAPSLANQPNASRDFRIYDDNVESTRLPDGRRFKYRVRPLRSGTMEFPGISVAYYDPASNGYVVVTTPAMPVQVEATTQIAATSQGGADPLAAETGLVGGAISPDGIMASSHDGSPWLFSRRASVRWSLLVGLPVLWGCAWLLRALLRLLLRHVMRKSPRRMAAQAWTAFQRTLRKGDGDPKERAVEAARAVRAYVAAQCRCPSVSLTADEMLALLEGRSGNLPLVRDFCRAFSVLEQLPYGPEGASADRVSAALSDMDGAMRALAVAFSHKAPTSLPVVLGALLLLAPAASQAMGRPSDSFEWERAAEAMASAKSPEDFRTAAGLYYGQVTNGAASGPLFFNLGTALLLAGHPGDACRAFVRSERYLGTFGGIARNWEMAIADRKTFDSYEPVRRLPVSRLLLCWHYGLPWAVRADIAAGGWIVLWAALLLRLLFTTKAPPGSPPGILRAFTNSLAVVGLALSLVFGASAAISHLQEKKDTLAIPSLEGNANQSEQPAGPAEDLP